MEFHTFTYDFVLKSMWESPTDIRRHKYCCNSHKPENTDMNTLCSLLDSMTKKKSPSHGSGTYSTILLRLENHLHIHYRWDFEVESSIAPGFYLGNTEIIAL